jgi:hypothetical protein
MEPWYKVATLRKEVREGRSFNPDEFAIALEQVVAGTAPADYRDPVQFFARTCFTRALREHAGMVLRRLAGQTDDTAPVLTLITQFGGGKTHTLTALYHLAKGGDRAVDYPGVRDLLHQSGLTTVPSAKVAVFVGNAWDPREGHETPWIDIARQLAGDRGVAELGLTARETAPGTDAIARVFEAADAPVLLLFDEVLNFMNRHRRLADSFYGFIQNLTVATTGTTHGAAVISLPRSQVEMTESDVEWQDRISKVVRRVAKDLIANDETEISEVIRRRLFENLGSEKIRKNVAGAFADWCFERRAQLPPEWTAVDTATSEKGSREFLRARFEACYPFHPATLSVFQRKWQALPQYQQTRGTLAMLAQWVAIASRDGFQKARTEPLITLGSAPLGEPAFRSIVLGQLGEPRLIAAIDADIAGDHSHARALDVDTSGPIRDIHRRVGAAIFFESSGGQSERIAHLPELRFAIGEPDIDTTTVDNVALALEDRSYFIRKVGSDGFRIGYQPTMKKVVNDRRASLDPDTETRPTLRRLVEDEFRRGASVPVIVCPEDGSAIADSPRLTLVVVDPDKEWSGRGTISAQIAEWTRQRGASPRLYPAALVWCLKKPGRDLRNKVELALAWQHVANDVADGTLGGEFDKNERSELAANVKTADGEARDEVWAGYRYAVIADAREPDGLKVIDLGAGHSSSGETLCGRVLGALRSDGSLSESIGAGYIERNWPPAFMGSGAWPLTSLRQSFLDGSLTRLIDPDKTLTAKIPEWVEQGDFGLASGSPPGGGYDRVWLGEFLSTDEVAFDPGVFLLRKGTAQSLVAGGAPVSGPEPMSAPQIELPRSGGAQEPTTPETGAAVEQRAIRLVGAIPPELWNRLGTKVLPKLRVGSELKVGIDMAVSVPADRLASLVIDLEQILDELGLEGSVQIRH